MIARNVFFLLVFIAVISCGKDRTGIPDVPVNFFIRLDNPTMQPLNTPGGSVIIDGHGVAGLIIHRSAFTGYVAFDRCSTVNPEKKCAVAISSNNPFTATDPCSKAVFLLEDGSPNPPAELPLKRYSVSISNNTIYVSN